MEPGALLRKMPDDVCDLRNDWPSRVDSIKGLTWELEQDFRFGQRVTKTERGYVMGGTLKSSVGTSAGSSASSSDTVKVSIGPGTTVTSAEALIVSSVAVTA